ncbi:MAG: ATP-binding protein [Bacteroidales bacterium]|jgi:AAA15 family ATPase/GTPase|nr:ATP-binding protein [Bacteroidales bacterium]
MIAEFTIGNFRSFKEKVTFSLISTKDRELSESNTFEMDNNLKFLKSAVIYGANASGKSNFFNALSFFLYFAVNSGPRKQIGDSTGTEPFAFSKQTEGQPSSFELIFYTLDEDGKNIRYRYGFSITEKDVIDEYLWAVYNVREVNLFIRRHQEITSTSYFKEGGRSKQFVRNNCSLLSVCAQNNGEISAQIIRYFSKMEVTSGLRDFRFITKKELHNQEYQQDIVNFLRYADIQINRFRSETRAMDSQENEDPELKAFLEYLKKKVPHFEEQERVFFGHTMYDDELPVGEKYLAEEDESGGTIKLFSYSIPILSALKNGTPLFIDEFDTMLHPLIIEAIIKLFNSPATNSRNAQLVISCHAVNILTNKLFRRDQIWFCEKDQFGATDLYSLVEYKEPVRKDASYNKNYLQGKYGAVPYINEILLQVGLHK